MAAALLFTALASLDGYVADSAGRFDWAEPDEQVHRFVNDIERTVGTHLYGRRMYEVMQVWERPDDIAPHRPAYIDEYAEIWSAADKIVYSTTLASASTPRTRIERAFDAAALATMKASADRTISIGGPSLAAHAWKARLVDECHLFVAPVVIGGGLRALPDGVRADLELLDQRRFSGGMVHLHYRIRERAAG